MRVLAAAGLLFVAAIGLTGVWLYRSVRTKVPGQEAGKNRDMRPAEPPIIVPDGIASDLHGGIEFMIRDIRKLLREAEEAEKKGDTKAVVEAYELVLFHDRVCPHTARKAIPANGIDLEEIARRLRKYKPEQAEK